MKLIPRNFYFDDIFDDFFAPTRNDLKCDIYEKDNNYILEMDIPGFEKKDIKIEENNGYLNITAQKDEAKEDKDINYIRRERNTQKYQRSFYLGDLEINNIKAEFKDGLLKIIAPKMAKIENKTRIEIE